MHVYDSPVPEPAPSLTGVVPLRVIEGGRLWLRGEALPVLSTHRGGCSIGGRPARLSFVARDSAAVIVPAGLDGGAAEVKVDALPGTTVFVEAATMLATGLHQVDSPAVDRQGRVYVTYSGSRGQQAPVSVFRITGPGQAREPFVLGLVNATSLAHGPDGHLYVSSRFDGAVYRVNEEGRHDVVASDLGVACGLAFAPDGTLLVGDRSGSIFHIDSHGRTQTLATLPASVAAFHLAMGPDDALYVTGPTLATRDAVYRVSMQGAVEVIDRSFGRPQGLAFDSQGVLHVVEALAGVSGVYELRPEGKSLVIAGARLVGLAWAPDGATLVCSHDTLYRFG